MNKTIYLLRGEAHESYSEFAGRIRAIADELLQTAAPAAIKFVLTEIAPPAVSIIPFSKAKMAAISVYGGTPDAAMLLRSSGFCGAYRVTEALPVSYHINWREGEATPGACLFTFFRKKQDIGNEAFLHRWHQVHTPHSLQIHPLWNYVRNRVDTTTTPHSLLLDGIVEEQMREERDLLNPFRFWGNPIVILPRMIKELIDTRSFIDYSSMETYLAAEYWVKMPATKA